MPYPLQSVFIQSGDLKNPDTLFYTSALFFDFVKQNLVVLSAKKFFILKKKHLFSQLVGGLVSACRRKSLHKTDKQTVQNALLYAIWGRNAHKNKMDVLQAKRPLGLRATRPPAPESHLAPATKKANSTFGLTPGFSLTARDSRICGACRRMGQIRAPHKGGFDFLTFCKSLSKAPCRPVPDAILKLVHIDISPSFPIIIRKNAHHVTPEVSRSHLVFFTERIKVYPIRTIKEMLPFCGMLPVCIAFFKTGDRPDI